MVNIDIDDDRIVVTPRGIHQLLAFKRRIEIPLSCLRAVRADPEAARGFFHGLRSPGTNVPGLLTAGTYYTGRERQFWAVRRRERVIVVKLQGHPFDRLIVEVDDPQREVARIEAARAAAGAA